MSSPYAWLVFGSILGYYLSRLLDRRERRRTERLARDVKWDEFERRDDERQARMRMMLGAMCSRSDGGPETVSPVVETPTRYPNEGLSPYLQRSFEKGRREEAARIRLAEQDRILRKLCDQQGDVGKRLQEVLDCLHALANKSDRKQSCN